MRVLILSHSSAVENLGGAERSMLGMIDDWRERRPETRFFVIARTPQGFLQPELDRRGIPVMTIPYGSWVLHNRVIEPPDLVRTAREDFAAIRAIERFIEGWEPDLVLTNTIVSPWAAIAARLVGVRHVWFPHEYGDDHEFQYPRDQTFGDIGVLSDLVVASSRGLRDYLSQWIDPEKLAVLYTRFDIPAMRELAARSDEDPAPFTDAADLRVVCVARIARSKGQARLARAIAELAARGLRVEAALVGTAEGPALRELEEELDSLGVADRVFPVGSRENPHPIIAAADVGVVVSDSEGFGRATVEYLVGGKPVVGFRIGGTIELVEHGVSGLLAESGDESAIADALEAYASDPALLAEHSANAAARAERDIAVRHTLDELLERLDRVAADPPAGATRLPGIFESWLDLPAVSLRYLTEAGATVDPRSAREWRLGRLVTGAPARARALLRNRGVRR